MKKSFILIISLLLLFSLINTAIARDFETQIEGNMNDCYYRRDVYNLFFNTSEMYFGRQKVFPFTYIYDSAWRFTNISIWPGSTINSAKLEVHRNRQVTPKIYYSKSIFYGLNESNCSVFKNSPNPDRPFSRNRTSESIKWDEKTTKRPMIWGWGDSPDFTKIVQEIINYENWTYNNSMGFVAIENSGDNYYFPMHQWDYDDNTYGAKLVIDFTPPRPVNPTNFIAETHNTTQINLSWMQGTNTTHTYIRYSNSSQPTSRTEGTLLYNDTGQSTIADGLEDCTTYYFSAWGFNDTWDSYSSGYAQANNETECLEIEVTINLSNEKPENNSNIFYYFCNDSFDMAIQRNSSDGSLMNTSIWFDGLFLFTNTSWGNGTIEFNLYDYINYTLVYDNVYNWTVNCSNGNYTNETFNFNTGVDVYCMDLAFDNLQFYLVIAIIVWIFLVTLGEWKEDWAYKIIQLPLGLMTGVTLLDSDMYLGLGMIFASIYILAIAYWQSRNKRED